MARSIGYKNFRFTLSGSVQSLSSARLYCFNFEIYSEHTNIKNIYTGDSIITSADGRIITPGEVFSPPSVTIGGNQDGYDLSKVYVLGETDEILRVIYATYSI